MNTDTTSSDKKPLSPLEQKRLEVEAKREANRRKAEELAEAREMALLEDEAAYEDARAVAYADPNVGPERCLGGLIEGAGYALFRWPDEITWRHFQNRGICKNDGLTTELADDLVCRVLLYPKLDVFREMMRKNPAATMAVAAEIKERMQPSEDALGKGLKSSRKRR